MSSGYPRYSLNYTTTYAFNGIGPKWLQGFKVGGSVLAYWKYSQYYYYPQSLSLNSLNRVMFYKPNLTIFNGIFGYTRKLARVTVTTPGEHQ